MGEGGEEECHVCKSASRYQPRGVRRTGEQGLRDVLYCIAPRNWLPGGDR